MVKIRQRVRRKLRGLSPEMSGSEGRCVNNYVYLEVGVL